MDLFRYRERHSPQTECGPLQRASAAVKFGVVSSYRLGNFICKWVGGLFQLFWGRSGDFGNLGHCPLLGHLTMLSWRLWVCLFTCWLRIKVWSCLPSWSYLILTSLCCVPRLCHFFKTCALSLSLLLHKGEVINDIKYCTKTNRVKREKRAFDLATHQNFLFVVSQRTWLFSSFFWKMKENFFFRNSHSFIGLTLKKLMWSYSWIMLSSVA